METLSSYSSNTIVERQYLCFSIGEERYGIGLSQVIEILEVPEITIVPRTEPWLLGVINLRGTILSVADISSFLSCRLGSPSSASRLVIITSPLFDLAIRVDSVLGILTINPETISSDQALSHNEVSLIHGVCKQGGNVFSILNTEALMGNERLRAYL